MAQPAPTVRQCTAVLTGVMIRHGVPITETLTADLTAVVTSRETALLEYLAGRARARVEQVLVHNSHSEAFRDGLHHAATSAARRAAEPTKRQRALQRLPMAGPVATIADGGTTATRSRGG